MELDWPFQLRARVTFPLAAPFEMPTELPGSLELLNVLSPLIRDLAQQGVIRNFRKGAVIIQEDDVGDSLFILLKGRAKAYSIDADDREITFGSFGPGEYFGEMALDGGTRSASVMALETVQCSVVTRDKVLGYLKSQPDFAMELVARVIARARKVTESARNMALLDVYERMVRQLDLLAGAGHGYPVELKGVTHSDIASQIGASREMVSRLLKDLEKGGYIELGIKRLTLLKKLPARW